MKNKKEIIGLGTKGLGKVLGGILVLGVSAGIGLYLSDKGKKKTREAFEEINQARNAYRNYKREKNVAESLGVYEKNLYEDIGCKESKSLYQDI